MAINDRGLSTSASSSLNDTTVYYNFIYELDLDSSTLRLADSVHNIKFDSDGDGSDETFIASPTPISFQAAEESIEIQSNPASFVISGIPNDNVDLALNEDYQNREFKAWIIVFSGFGSQLDSMLVFSGLMDQMTINKGPESSEIEITLESYLVDITTRRYRRYTNEDQTNFVDSNDTGLSYLASLQNKPLLFGPRAIEKVADNGFDRKV